MDHRILKKSGRGEAVLIVRETKSSAFLCKNRRQTSPRLAATDARIHPQRHTGVQHAADGKGIHGTTLYSRRTGTREFLARRLWRSDSPQPMENADAKGLAASASVGCAGS